jgi:DNA mismatch endonuclease (patch repair protein)
LANIFTPAKRSEIMSLVKTKDTVPELRVRRLLHALGLRFRLHRKDLPGKPDIVLPQHKKIILVHGCFWHRHSGCPQSAVQTINKRFWQAKFERNIDRDQRVQKELENLGWDVLVIWQ